MTLKILRFFAPSNIYPQSYPNFVHHKIRVRESLLSTDQRWEAHGKQAIEGNMADENDHLAKLVAVRSRMVTERREVASALIEKASAVTLTTCASCWYNSKQR
jgi:hypothetical protein